MSRVEEMIDCEDYDQDSSSWGRREAARIKQIQIGKSRPEYQRYLREVPHHSRTRSQPGTPDPRARVSKRQFDRDLGEWRRRLHEFDAVPRGPPRSCAELEASWSTPSKTTWGSPEKTGGKGAGATSPHQDFAGMANRRSRGGAAERPRGERIGKFGPRKPADSTTIVDVLSPPEPVLAPPPPPLMPQGQASAAAQPGAVRISLADQLMEMPMMSPQMMAPAPDCYWYQGPEAWGNMETPPKAFDCQFMPMETPDKTMMPGHMMQMPMYDEAAMKADYSFMNMPVESDMLPHRLFDSSPDKSEQSLVLENNSSNSETTGLESGDSGNSPAARVAPASPRTRPFSADSLMPLMSPPPRFLRTPIPSTPSALLGTPIPSTPKRQCYVPETPSPERMHYSWLPQTMPYAMTAAHPWHYGVQAPAQVIPEFMQLMSCVPHEGQNFGALA